MPKQCKITMDMLNWAFEQKLDGYSYYLISEALGMDGSYLKRVLELHDMVPSYPRLKYPKRIRFDEKGLVILDDDVLVWAQSKLLQGYTQKSVADSLGVSAARLASVLKRKGLETKHPPLVYQAERREWK